MICRFKIWFNTKVLKRNGNKNKVVKITNIKYY